MDVVPRRPADIPLLLPTACFVAGLLAGFHPLPPTGAMLLILAVIIAFFFRRPAIASLTLILAAGWIDASLHLPPHIPSAMTRTGAVWSGRVIRVSESESAVNTDIEVDSTGSGIASLHPVSPFRLRLTIAGFGHDITDTDRIAWRGRIMRNQQQQLPPIMTDHHATLLRRGIAATCVIRPDSVLRVSAEPGWTNTLRRLRGSLSMLLFDSGLEPSTAILLNAVLLGDTSLITADRRATYSTAGLSHLLALSGMHVAIIAMIISLVLAPLYLMRKRRIMLLITIAALWIYAVVTGLSPSVVRAVIMATVFAGSRLLQRRPSPFNSLCLAALAILLVDPLSLFSYGFQLSFAAVAAILLFARPLNPVSPRRHIAHTLTGYLTVSIAAMAGTGIISAYHFHSFPLYFLIPAIAASMIMPVICPCGIAIMAAGACGVPSGWLCHIADTLCRLLDHIAAMVASWPAASITGIYFHPATVWLAIGALAALALYIRVRRRSMAYAATMIAAAAAITAAVTAPRPDGDIRITLMPYSRHATLIVRRADTAWIMTSAPAADSALVKMHLRRDLEKYLAVNRVRDLRMMPAELHDGALSVSGGVVEAGAVSISLGGSQAGRRVTYAIATEHTRSPQIAGLARADTIVIARSVRPRMAARVSEEASPVPVITALDISVR